MCTRKDIRTRQGNPLLVNYFCFVCVLSKHKKMICLVLRVRSLSGSVSEKRLRSHLYRTYALLFALHFVFLLAKSIIIRTSIETILGNVSKFYQHEH